MAVANGPGMTRLGCALLLLILSSAWRTCAQGYVNVRAPELAVEKWITARPNTSGKFVLFEIWATWCPACRQSVPRLNELHRKFSDKIAIIGLSDEKEEVLRT